MGGGILIIKNNSLPNLLSQVYSNFKWDKLLFKQQSDIWNDDNLANYFVEWLKKQPENEISIFYQIISDMGKKGAFSLTQALQNAFPKYKWAKNVTLSAKKSQYILKEYLEKLFASGGENTLLLMEEYRHPDVDNLELDYFLPQYNLAFEYQVNKLVRV